MWARELGCVGSPSWATDTDGFPRPRDTWSWFVEAYFYGPIRRGMMLLTTNGIAELVVFCG